MTDLPALAKAAARDGWATTPGSLSSIRDQAKSLGWTEVVNRQGDPAVTALRPRTREDAHPHSLSVAYGLGGQPLHTDGAHLPEPPDILVLACEHGSSTPTLLWRSLTGPGRTPLPWAASHHGMFLVRNGRDSFYTAVSTRNRYRFDPGCMTACDGRAQQIAAYFDDQLSNATAHEWAPGSQRAPGPQLLIVDNRRSLHARAALSTADEQRTLVRVAFRIGPAS